jgi:hypothetical protein
MSAIREWRRDKLRKPQTARSTVERHVAGGRFRAAGNTLLTLSFSPSAKKDKCTLVTSVDHCQLQVWGVQDDPLVILEGQV